MEEVRGGRGGGCGGGGGGGVELLLVINQAIGLQMRSEGGG